MDETKSSSGEKLLSEYGKGTFSIGEVATMLGVHTHTIRFWEKSFRIVIPRKESNRRRYTLADITLLKKIQRLVHKDKLSLNTARCQLEAEGVLPPTLEEEAPPEARTVTSRSNISIGRPEPITQASSASSIDSGAQASKVMESVTCELRAVVKLLREVSGKG